MKKRKNIGLIALACSLALATGIMMTGCGSPAQNAADQIASTVQKTFEQGNVECDDCAFTYAMPTSSSSFTMNLAFKAGEISSQTGIPAQMAIEGTISSSSDAESASSTTSNAASATTSNVASATTSNVASNAATVSELNASEPNANVDSEMAVEPNSTLTQSGAQQPDFAVYLRGNTLYYSISQQDGAAGMYSISLDSTLLSKAQQLSELTGSTSTNASFKISDYYKDGSVDGDKITLTLDGKKIMMAYYKTAFASYGSAADEYLSQLESYLDESVITISAQRTSEGTLSSLSMSWSLNMNAQLAQNAGASSATLMQIQFEAKDIRNAKSVEITYPSFDSCVDITSYVSSMIDSLLKSTNSSGSNGTSWFEYAKEYAAEIVESELGRESFWGSSVLMPS